MKQIQIDWEKISISNDFVFGKVMENLELCKELLQIILPALKIEHIEVPQLQKGIDIDKDAHGIRLDVYVQDKSHTVYSIEMQMVNTKNLEKRVRYYSSVLDIQLLNKSENYKELHDSYLIFICPFDLFGAGRHIYTFKSTCQEDSSILLEDGTERIFLNTEGKIEDISEELKAFLDYVAGRASNGLFIKKLEAAVKDAKQDREWRRQVMTLLMRDQENQEKGREEGEARAVEVLKLHLKGKTDNMIASELNMDILDVQDIINKFEQE